MFWSTYATFNISAYGGDFLISCCLLPVLEGNTTAHLSAKWEEPGLNCGLEQQLLLVCDIEFIPSCTCIIIGFNGILPFLLTQSYSTLCIYTSYSDTHYSCTLIHMGLGVQCHDVYNHAGMHLYRLNANMSFKVVVWNLMMMLRHSSVAYVYIAGYNK